MDVSSRRLKTYCLKRGVGSPAVGGSIKCSCHDVSIRMGMLMSDAIHWDDHYRKGRPPCESRGGPSTELQRVSGEQRIAPGRVFELGCGSGINAVWLAQQGFDVT